MKVIYAIAEYHNIPNEFVTITKAVDNILWYTLKGGAKYSCLTVRKGTALKKNSIRID